MFSKSESTDQQLPVAPPTLHKQFSRDGSNKHYPFIKSNLHCGPPPHLATEKRLGQKYKVKPSPKKTFIPALFTKFKVLS